jgi:HlyD family secretion protein
MRTLIILAIIVAVLAAGGAAVYKPAMDYWQQRSMPNWKTAEVTRGDIISTVNATGTVKPALQISVGAFVSGPIDAEYQIKDQSGKPLFDKDGQPKHIVEFNEDVKKGDVLAKIQDVIYIANRDRDQANYDSRIADVERVKALVWQAKRDEWRALDLREKNDKFIAQSETDKAQFNRMQLEAQEKLAEAAVKQAKAQLDFSIAQLDYTTIRSPADGTVINRKIDPGQTLAAQFQTPELFVIAPDMEKHMYVHASVDEADIGLIRDARVKELPVTFTVDAWSDLFTGQIEEIRLSSATTQNVVTYPVVIVAPNPDRKLLPGMTASISFEVDRRDNCVKIPNSALRFFPQPQYVRTEDKPLLEGQQDAQAEQEELPDSGLAAHERADTRKKRSRRHVWIQDGVKLRAVEVQAGIADSHFTELVSGDLKPDDKLVIGIKPPTPWGQ